jgi:hypothetical protein
MSKNLRSSAKNVEKSNNSKKSVLNGYVQKRCSNKKKTAADEKDEILKRLEKVLFLKFLFNCFKLFLL